MSLIKHAAIFVSLVLVSFIFLLVMVSTPPQVFIDSPTFLMPPHSVSLVYCPHLVPLISQGLLAPLYSVSLLSH